MNIAFVLSDAASSGGGLQTAALQLGSQIAQTQSLTIFSSQVDATSFSLAKPAVVQRVGYIGWHKIELPLRLGSHLKERDVDIIHRHGIWSLDGLALRLVERSLPIIISPHGMLDPWALQISRAKKDIVKFLYEGVLFDRVAAWRALCEQEAASIRALGFRAPIAVIPNGVPLSLIANQPRIANVGQKSLLYLGRLDPKKGIDILLHAFAQLSSSTMKDWRIVIAGWGRSDYVRFLQEVTVELGLQSRVNFFGPVFGDRKFELLRSVDALALTSLSEGLPMVVLEAWASGLPVVISRACNLDIGEIWKAAFLVDAEIGSIQQGLTRLASSSPQTLAEMGCNGVRLVNSQFNLRTKGEEMLSLYNWVLGRGDRPGFVQQ